MNVRCATTRVHHKTRRIRTHKLRLRGGNRPSCAVRRSYCVRARTYGPNAPHCLHMLQTSGTHHLLGDGVLHIAGEGSCVACNAPALECLSVHRDAQPDWQRCPRAAPTTEADNAQVACALAVARYRMRSLARRSCIVARERRTRASPRRQPATAACTSAWTTWQALDTGLLQAIEERTSAIRSACACARLSLPSAARSEPAAGSLAPKQAAPRGARQ